MMNKQNLWFLTLFSLILVLSVYYVTMPNDLLLTTNSNYNDSETKKSSSDKEEEVSVVVEDAELISSMKLSKEEERLKQKSDYQKVLTNTEATTDEKNEALEKIKSLDEVKAEEESLETKIKDKFKLDCYVEKEETNINSVCVSDKHDNTLANNIMRLIQGEYDDHKYITVKFEKS